MYRIKFRASAVKEILSLQHNLQQRVRSAIDLLSENPRPVGYRKLKGRNDLYRIRISDVRVVYEIADQIKIIEIIRIGNRGAVYKNL